MASLVALFIEPVPEPRASFPEARERPRHIPRDEHRGSKRPVQMDRGEGEAADGEFYAG